MVRAQDTPSLVTSLAAIICFRVFGLTGETARNVIGRLLNRDFAQVRLQMPAYLARAFCIVNFSYAWQRGATGHRLNFLSPGPGLGSERLSLRQQSPNKYILAPSKEISYHRASRIL